MKAFVLAAGFGTRLLPLTGVMPKPLIPVLNIPSLCYTLFLLKEAGIRQVICNIHHHPEQIRAFFDSHDFQGLDIVLSEEKTILGTGGGLKRCEPLLDDDHFLLINSDIIADIDLSTMIRHHRASGLAGTLALYETPESVHLGHVGVENGLVRDFRNMRKSGLESEFIYTGTAVLSPEIFRYLHRDFSGIVDTGFTGLIDNGGIGYYHHKGLWLDIGTLGNLYRANLDNNFRILNYAERMKELIGMFPCMVSREVSLQSGARIVNSVVGSGCVIGRGALVEESVLLPGTVVEAGSTISRAIAWQHGVIPLHP